MRKVSALELVSLDGVMESPENWSLQFHNDEMAEANASGTAAADAMLLGRVTYQEFASYWPYQNSADQPFTDYLNNTTKYVVSTTLAEPLEWQSSTLIKRNLAEEVAGRDPRAERHCKVGRPSMNGDRSDHVIYIDQLPGGENASGFDSHEHGTSVPF